MPDGSSRLILLRFRDIELPPGESIIRHRRTIAEYGYCWWGWLFRDYERNPYADLKKFGSSLADPEEAVQVGLFDTGRSMIFQTICEEIRSTEHPQRSPQPHATPAYYNDRKAPAWFKLTEIKEVDLSYVIGRTCVSMPSASEECFVDLIGQPVTHIRELRKQEVTLWVLG